MKKMTVIVSVAFIAVSMNAFAWGKKEKAVTPAVTTTMPASVEKTATAAAQVPAAPAEQKRLISFDRLVKVLLNEGVSTELNLTAGQKATIASASEGMRSDLKAARDEFNAKTVEIRAEYEAKIKPFKDQLRAKADAVKRDKVEELNKTLTKEQQEKLALVMEDPKKFLK